MSLPVTREMNVIIPGIECAGKIPMNTVASASVIF